MADIKQVQLEVRKINPPKLEYQNLQEYILCHRPMRRQSPAMFLENINQKLVAHNYGHGGSGWTLAPGAAKYVVGLLDDRLKKEQKSKDIPIVVVGAGCIGLFSALELFDQGYTQITVLAENFESLTSNRAGGLLAPVSLDVSPQMKQLIDLIGIQAYTYFKSIAEGQNKYLTKGAKIMSSYFQNRDESGLEPYVGVVMEPAKDVILDFQNGTTRQMVVYDDGIFIDTWSLMRLLIEVLEGKVKFEKRRINSFDELQQNVVLNCTGIGPKDFLNDQNMVSVQGHLIQLQNQNPQDINYLLLLYLDKQRTKQNLLIKRAFYLLPKQIPSKNGGSIGVIGGTFIEGADNSTPHHEEFETLIQNAHNFFGLKRNINPRL